MNKNIIKKVLYIQNNLDEKSSGKMLEESLNPLLPYTIIFTVVPNAFEGLDYTEHSHFDVLVASDSLVHMSAKEMLLVLRNVGVQTPMIAIVNDNNSLPDLDLFSGILYKNFRPIDLSRSILNALATNETKPYYKIDHFSTSLDESLKISTATEAHFMNTNTEICNTPVPKTCPIKKVTINKTFKNADYECNVNSTLEYQTQQFHRKLNSKEDYCNGFPLMNIAQCIGNDQKKRKRTEKVSRSRVLQINAKGKSKQSIQKNLLKDFDKEKDTELQLMNGIEPSYVCTSVIDTVAHFDSNGKDSFQDINHFEIPYLSVSLEDFILGDIFD